MSDFMRRQPGGHATGPGHDWMRSGPGPSRLPRLRLPAMRHRVNCGCRGEGGRLPPTDCRDAHGPGYPSKSDSPARWPASLSLSQWRRNFPGPVSSCCNETMMSGSGGRHSSCWPAYCNVTVLRNPGRSGRATSTLTYSVTMTSTEDGGPKPGGEDHDHWRPAPGGPGATTSTVLSQMHLRGE
jgi:hypothetical protein